MEHPPNKIYTIETRAKIIIKFSNDLKSIGIARNNHTLAYGNTFAKNCNRDEIYSCIVGILLIAYDEILFSKNVMDRIEDYITNCQNKDILKNLHYALSTNI